MNEENIYDITTHLPSQMETLMQMRATGNIPGFKHVLGGIQQIIEQHLDDSSHNKDIQGLIKNCLKQIETMLQGDRTEDTLVAIKQILASAEAEYETIEVNYMNEVVELLVSYISQNNTETTSEEDDREEQH